MLTGLWKTVASQTKDSRRCELCERCYCPGQYDVTSARFLNYAVMNDGFITPVTFTCFARLPIELRTKIWKQALPAQRLVQLHIRQNIHHFAWEVSHACYQIWEGTKSVIGADTTLLTVCAESRAAYLGSYTPMRRFCHLPQDTIPASILEGHDHKKLHHEVYIDKAHDTVLLEYGDQHYLSSLASFPSSFYDTLGLQNIAIAPKDMQLDLSTGLGWNTLRQRFSSLKTLHILLLGAKHFSMHENTLHVVNVSEDLTHRTRHYTGFCKEPILPHINHKPSDFSPEFFQKSSQVIHAYEKGETEGTGTVLMSRHPYSP
jgi:hypothetical protein